MDTDQMELELLQDQLRRMRGMLFGYSERFFDTIRNWALVTIGLLVLGIGGVVPAAVLLIPFIVPFAFLETGYLFYYTVFARRHAERLEQAINARLGSEVMVAHRLEAAYFYPPDAPKIAALSFGNPAGFMSVMTLGYTGGAILLWGAGLAGSLRLVADGMGDLAPVIVLQLVWTALITAYLLWTSLARPDERRLLQALDAGYPKRGPTE